MAEDLGGLPDGVVMGSRAAVKAAFVAHRAMMASANLDQLHQQHVTFTKASFFESIPYDPCHTQEKFRLPDA